MSHKQFCSLQKKSRDALEGYGGVEGLAGKLGSSLQKGVNSSTLGSRREVFGQNKFESAEMKSFWKLVYENLQDPTLILLMAAALVSLSPSSSSFGLECFMSLI